MAGMPVADRRHRLGDLDAFGLQVVAQRDQGDLDAGIRDGQARPHRGDEGRAGTWPPNALAHTWLKAGTSAMSVMATSALTTRASEEPAARARAELLPDEVGEFELDAVAFHRWPSGTVASGAIPPRSPTPCAAIRPATKTKPPAFITGTKDEVAGRSNPGGKSGMIAGPPWAATRFMVTAALGNNNPAEHRGARRNVRTADLAAHLMKEGIARQSGRTDRIEPRGSVGAAGLEHGPRPPPQGPELVVQSGSPERGRADEPNRVGIRPEAKIQSPTRAAGQVRRPDSPRRAGAVARQSCGNGLYGFGQKADEPWIWLAMDAKSSPVTDLPPGGSPSQTRHTAVSEDAFDRERP